MEAKQAPMDVVQALKKAAWEAPWTLPWERPFMFADAASIEGSAEAVETMEASMEATGACKHSL